MPESFDPVDVLRTHVRAVALLERPRDHPDDLIERITRAEVPASVVPLRSPRRRRWWIAGAATTVVVVGGAGVAAWVGARPDEQIRDVLCRTAADARSSALAVTAGSDPIGACASLWRSGAMAREGGTVVDAGAVPRLVACTGSDRPIEVYPVEPDGSCASLGLLDADVSAGETDAVVRLQEIVAGLDGSDRCTSSSDLGRILERTLDVVALSDWKVSVVDPSAPCAVASVDGRSSTVFVVPAPPLDT